MPNIELRASDGHTFGGHRVDPLEPARGAVVVVQEIFGVNRHIRAVASRFAAAGYAAIAPAFFDRIRPGIELGYDKADLAQGRELVGKLEAQNTLADLQATIDLAATASASGRVDIVGYCWGGAVVWIAAARLTGLHAAVSYYGSRIVNYADEAPRVPLLMQVGRSDASFPLETVREIAARHPGVEMHDYQAGHGFSCDHRGDFDSTAAAHAWTRTLAWFDR